MFDHVITFGDLLSYSVGCAIGAMLFEILFTKKEES